MNPVYMHPYVEIDGVRTFPDSFIRWLFEEAERQERAEWMFSSGSVDNPETFLDEMKHYSQLWILSGSRVLNGAGSVIGFSWLNNFHGRSAEAHFCVLCKDRDMALLAGKTMLRSWLNAASGGEYVLDVVIGLTPKINRAAVRFARDLGMVRAGEIPHRCLFARNGKTYPGVLSYATRKEVENHGWIGHQNR